MDAQQHITMVQEQIEHYIKSQPEPICSDLQTLHNLMLKVMPGCRLWFLDGKNSANKTVANPIIGYGVRTLEDTNGKNKEFYHIGLSANPSGIAIYLFGMKDKKYLAQTYEKKLGRASVTGYSIKFRALKDINIAVLEAAIRDDLALTMH